MKVKNTITGKVYSDIEAALKDNCISNFSLAIAINKNYLWKKADAAELCATENFLYAWEKGVQWVAEDIKRKGNYSQFNLLPLEMTFSKGDTVMITDAGQIYDTYSDIFGNYKDWGLTLQDVAEWCYGDIYPDLYSYYTVKATISLKEGRKMLYIKSKTSNRGYLISPEGIKKVER